MTRRPKGVRPRAFIFDTARNTRLTFEDGLRPNHDEPHLNERALQEFRDFLIDAEVLTIKMDMVFFNTTPPARHVPVLDMPSNGPHGGRSLSRTRDASHSVPRGYGSMI